MTRTTHTYATLAISPTAFEEVRARLEEAGVLSEYFAPRDGGTIIFGPVGLVQNSSPRLFGELYLDEAGEAHFVCHTRDDDFGGTKAALLKFIALLQDQLERERSCPFFKEPNG